MVRVGVLALQGGVREHQQLLEALGAKVVLVRTPADLTGPDGLRIDGLVLPGGESSTIDRLLRTFGTFDPLRDAIIAGLPTLGTCAGLVLLADRVIDPAPGQQSLQVLDVTVRRNAFGPQVDSAEVDLTTIDGPVRVAFIRAPLVTKTGQGVQVLARHLGGVVGVRQGRITGIAFHPELTGETVFHRRLLADIAAPSDKSEEFVGLDGARLDSFAEGSTSQVTYRSVRARDRALEGAPAAVKETSQVYRCEESQ